MWSADLCTCFSRRLPGRLPASADSGAQLMTVDNKEDSAASEKQKKRNKDSHPHWLLQITSGFSPDGGFSPPGRLSTSLHPMFQGAYAQPTSFFPDLGFANQVRVEL